MQQVFQEKKKEITENSSDESAMKIQRYKKQSLKLH